MNLRSKQSALVVMIGEEMPLKQDNGKSWRGRRKTSPQRPRENKKLKTSLAADRMWFSSWCCAPPKGKEKSRDFSVPLCRSLPWAKPKGGELAQAPAKSLPAAG